jgi:hypothetical protein
MADEALPGKLNQLSTEVSRRRVVAGGHAGHCDCHFTYLLGVDRREHKYARQR